MLQGSRRGDNSTAGIGRFYNQTINQMLHAVVRGTSNAILLALRRRF